MRRKTNRDDLMIPAEEDEFRVIWLPWPFSSSMRYRPTICNRVYGSNTFVSHCMAIISLVYPFDLWQYAILRAYSSYTRWSNEVVRIGWREDVSRSPENNALNTCDPCSNTQLRIVGSGSFKVNTRSLRGVPLKRPVSSTLLDMVLMHSVREEDCLQPYCTIMTMFLS